MVCGDCIDMTSGTVAMNSAVSANRLDGCHARRGVFGKNSAINEMSSWKSAGAKRVTAAAGIPQPALCISIRIAPAIAPSPDRSATLRIVCGALQSTEPESEPKSVRCTAEPKTEPKSVRGIAVDGAQSASRMAASSSNQSS